MAAKTHAKAQQALKDKTNMEQAKPKVIHPGETSNDTSPGQLNQAAGSEPSSHSPTSSSHSSKPGGRLGRSTGALRAKPGLIVALLVILLLIVVGLIYGSHKPSAVAYAGGSVSINSGSFFPKTISIKPGQAVTWTNYDSSPHWIASDPYPKDDGFASLNSGGALKTGDSYSLSFSKAGTYTYHDELNPFKLQGTVVVR